VAHREHRKLHAPAAEEAIAGVEHRVGLLAPKTREGRVDFPAGGFSTPATFKSPVLRTGPKAKAMRQDKWPLRSSMLRSPSCFGLARNSRTFRTKSGKRDPVVVTAAVTTGRPGRRGLSLFCATVLLAGIAISPTPTLSASSSSVGSPSSPFTLRRKVIRRLRIEPSATRFFSLLSSHGPMSVIAPTVYGDFRSPALSPSIGSGVRPMSETEGVDPAVTTMFDGTLKVGLLPGTGSASAGESIGGLPNTDFGVGSNGAVDDSNAAVSTIPTISGGGGTPTFSGAGETAGTQPVCSDNQLARGLEAGGKYWNVQGMLAKPKQFLPGMATGIGVSNPVGGLGRSGNQSNVDQPGPAGGWCRPAPGPFWQSSPLESPFLWTGVAALLVGIVVFWLSRGIKIPPARSGHFNHARTRFGLY
jgi:hypothetical protein